MKQRSAPKKPRGAYHHGDLSRAAQDVGASLVEQVGPSGFTLAEVAKRLGILMENERPAGTGPVLVKS